VFRILALDPALGQSLSQNNIDFVDIEIFINTENKIDIWSCYILPNSNVSQQIYYIKKYGSDLVINNIFNKFSANFIFGGDLNDHHPI